MSGHDLRVTTARLRELAVQQGRAAGGIRSATIRAETAEAAVRNTHGSIASASANALAAVLVARRSAGTKMAEISEDMCDKLIEAAKRYDQLDNTMSGALRAQMQPGQR